MTATVTATAAPTAKTADELHADLTRAAQVLKALEAEKQELPDLVKAAARDADSDRLIALRRRLDEIDDHIFAARVKTFAARKAILEHELAEGQAALPQIREEVAVTRAAYEQAREAWEDASFQETAIRAAASDLRLQISALDRQIEELLADASADKGPIVRSGWQRG